MPDKSKKVEAGNKVAYTVIKPFSVRVPETESLTVKLIVIVPFVLIHLSLALAMLLRSC